MDSESDDRGILGISEEVSAGPAGMRVAVRKIVEWGLKHCPVDDAVRRAIPVELDLRIG